MFIFDRTDHCFVWIGKNASIDERKNSMSYGHVSIVVLATTKAAILDNSIVTIVTIVVDNIIVAAKMTNFVICGHSPQPSTNKIRDFPCNMISVYGLVQGLANTEGW